MKPGSNVLHIVALAVLALVISVGAASASEVTVKDAWIRALPNRLPAGGYFTLHNSGKTPLTLTGAVSPACGMLMLHKSENMGGMMHMKDVHAIDVPAGGTLTFAPGGYHLMCMEPSPEVKPGATVKVTLHFGDGSRIEAPFAVRSAMGR